jgi:hypothetical protein
MQFHQMAHYRQPQAETAMCPPRVAFELAEAVEDEGEKLRLDPHAGVAHNDRDVLDLALKTDSDLPSSGCELDSVGQEIPDDLLQAVGVYRRQPRRRIER